ncbi:MAG: glycosyltransferase [Candidatus Riflebacteria bacterium]|nr:glycosyltransferase [Candidatus Riflebacteria bacterium]
MAYVVGGLAWLWANRESYDVIHCHQLLSPATIGALARRLTGRPALAKLACSGRYGDVSLIRSHPFAWMRRLILRGNLSAFICLNDEMERELAGWLGPVQVHRVPNGIDAGAFEPRDAGARAALRSRLGVSGFALVFTGALRAQKNLGLAISALARLPDRVHLWIVGDGAERSRLASLAEASPARGRVHFVGSVDDVRPHLFASDAFVLPSVAEGVSNALLEAMAAGLPPIVSAIPGNASVVENGKEGLLFDPADEADLARAVNELESDERKARELGLAARNRVLRDLDLERIARRYEEIYATLIASQRR